MENPRTSIFKELWMQSLAGIFILILITAGTLLYKSVTSYVSIENSIVSAPVISIGPEASGILEETYVRTGDEVTAGQILARVGAEVLSAKVPGIVIMVNNTPGQIFSPGQAVVQMIEPKELRIVGTIKENEGLSDIVVGDPVSFTLDAFSSKTFTGVVDSISATSKESGVVFSISDKREVKQFEIKVKYDITANPEFKNGMSAKIKVFKK